MKSKSKITGQDLLGIGYTEGPALGLALSIAQGYRGKSKAARLTLLERVLREPALYRDHALLGELSQVLIQQEQTTQQNLTERKDYTIYGADGIEGGAIHQMEIAMKLPITVAGALMPDAHQGYGLPIGGVLATDNAVIPYGVGMDIGCRMCMSIYDISPTLMETQTYELKKSLVEHSRFGLATFDRPRDHEILSDSAFDEISMLRGLKGKAWSQMGTSGGGNHFVEYGTVEIADADNAYELPVGKYLAVLSHSGSRGLGAAIARHYTDVAKRSCELPKEARHLAWLDLDSEAGIEYWRAMTLAGDYASACHHQIHDRLSEYLGEKPRAMIENHHNFAWKEQDADDREIIVHRKGATPAGAGVYGIIPGSMTAPGYIVRGRGHAESLNSAAHGAGRQMSRSKAKQQLSKKEVAAYIKSKGVDLIGAGLDEAPMPYKDIQTVMAAQTDLVDIVGIFSPRIVRMCGDAKLLGIDS